MDLTHASFFSGVGGMDRGLEAAGWRTVSVSEIEPYACSILAERRPEVPNIGCIEALAGYVPQHPHGYVKGKLTCLVGDERSRDDRLVGALSGEGSDGRDADPERIQPADALLRSKRASVDGPPRERGGHIGSRWTTASLWSGGFPCQDLSVAGKRRGMGEGTRSGLAFAFLELVAVHNPPLILLENVPGLLSSHGGRDMAVLLSTMVELGYGVGYRVLNAQFFGVPQRRRRVFIVGIKADGRAGAERAAEVLSVGSRCRWHPQTGGKTGTVAAAGIGHSVTGSSGKRHDTDTDTHIVHRQEAHPNRVREIDGMAGWLDDPKQDAHRYRCCGNGVVANVTEWLGVRLREEAERM